MTEGRDRKTSGDQLAHLSDDDVERRLGGGAGLGGPVEPRPPVATPPPGGRPPSRGRGMLWRDGAMAVALLAFLLIGARFALNWQPTSSQATSSPGSSDVARASETPVPATTTPAPPATPSPTPFEVIPSDLPTATPEPTPTPLPTPTPTVAPGTPTPAPQATPGTARVTVYFQVINDDGDTHTNPADWTITAGGAAASPSSFSAGSTPRVVTVRSGSTYTISASGPSGYGISGSSECHAKLPAGGSGICTVTANDKPAALQVTTLVSGGSAAPSDFTIQITGTDVSPAGGAPGGTGVKYTFDANAAYGYVAPTGPAGYTANWSTSCQGVASSAINGVTNLCSLTLSYTGGAMPVRSVPVGMPILLPIVFRRRPARRA